MTKHMKQVTISTGKATILALEIISKPIFFAHYLSDMICIVSDEKIGGSDNWLSSTSYNQATNKTIYNNVFRLPEGQWKHVGQPYQLTEKDWKGIVDEYVVSHEIDDLTEVLAFKDYVNGICEDDNVDWDYWDEYSFDTATESGLSLLKANGVVMENEFGEEPVLSDYIFEDHPELVGNPKEYDHEKFESDHKEWQQAQEQVWVNPHVFIKID